LWFITVWGVFTPAAGETLTVSTTSEAVNGDSSPAALIRNPGPDGISLVEATTAAESKTGYDTIAFDPSLGERRYLSSVAAPPPLTPPAGGGGQGA